MSVNPRTSRSGHVGLPVSGNDAKLVPNNGKLEVRAKGPNVTPGYWRQPELTAAAFDEEGFYKFGDALKPVDPDDFDAGFDFDGRIAEDFKLAQRHLGQRRSAARALCRGLRAAGARRRHRRHQPRRILGAGRARSRRLPPDQSDAAARRSRRAARRSADPRTPFASGLTKFLADATGSSTRITRAVLLDTPLSIDRGEVTDKGSINQRAVLEHRSRADRGALCADIRRRTSSRSS